MNSYLARNLKHSVSTFAKQSRGARLSPFALRSRSFASPVQNFATKSNADEKIEELQELYATAKDEFEIATEETEKKTVYAADDRAAASEELGNLKKAFDEAVKGQNGDEIKRRIGQRIRELDNAVEALEEKAKED